MVNFIYFLFSGTLRPDLIESAALSVTKKADIIKTHHNVTDLVKKLSLEVSCALFCNLKFSLLAKFF